MLLQMARFHSFLWLTSNHVCVCVCVCTHMHTTFSLPVHPSPTLVISCLFVNKHYHGMRSFLIMVLICISLMIRDVEHIFMHLLAICIPSSDKCLFKSAHFVIKLLMWFSCRGSLYNIFRILNLYQI